MTTNETFENLRQQGVELFKMLHLEELEAKKINLELKLNNPEIWENPKFAGELSQEISKINQKLNLKLKFNDLIENLEISLDLADEKNANKLNSEITNFLESISNEALFTGPFDDEDCYLTVQSGAGGVDAQDWAAMLVSMYQAFCKRQDFDYQTLNISLNSEGGVKSCLLEIKGLHAFGLFKEEAGVHRLIRLSPFNSGSTRETSFALVEIIPASVENSEIKVEINEKDLRWETSTSQGAGGQSVNTTYSAVKVIHEPTGITVNCQNERSQIQNRAKALKILKSRLYALEIQKQKDAKDELKGDFKSPEWGSQIRSYTLHPYKLVKDHRSNWESGNPTDILENGNLLEVIMSVKKSSN